MRCAVSSLFDLKNNIFSLLNLMGGGIFFHYVETFCRVLCMKISFISVLLTKYVQEKKLHLMHKCFLMITRPPVFHLYIPLGFFVFISKYDFSESKQMFKLKHMYMSITPTLPSSVTSFYTPV